MAANLGAGSSPGPPTAAPHDSNRMQLLARSVSITVNPAQHESGAMNGPQPAMVHAGHAFVPPAPVNNQTGKQPSNEKTEEQEEERLALWVGSINSIRFLIT